MKRYLALILIIILAFAFNTFADGNSAENKLMMKKWMEYATQGQFHKGLEYFTGKWTSTSKMWMKPGDKPIESTGTDRAEMIMGGRFLVAHMSGSSMGKKFTGMSVVGFDNLKKKFVGYWLDSTATSIFPFEGTLDKTGKIRTDTGVWDDFMTGSKQKVRMVTTIVDKDTYKFEMFMTTGNLPEFKSMEMIYSRTKCKSKEKCCKKKEADKKGKCKKEHKHK